MAVAPKRHGCDAGATPWLCAFREGGRPKGGVTECGRFCSLKCFTTRYIHIRDSTTDASGPSHPPPDVTFGWSAPIVYTVRPSAFDRSILSLSNWRHQSEWEFSLISQLKWIYLGQFNVNSIWTQQGFHVVIPFCVINTPAHRIYGSREPIQVLWMKISTWRHGLTGVTIVASNNYIYSSSCTRAGEATKALSHSGSLCRVIKRCACPDEILIFISIFASSASLSRSRVPELPAPST